MFILCYLAIYLLKILVLTSFVAMTFKRAFSATAKALIKFIWEGTVAHPNYEKIAENKMKKNPKLIGARRGQVCVCAPTTAPYSMLHSLTQTEANLINPIRTRRCAPRARFSGARHVLLQCTSMKMEPFVYSKQSVNDAQED